MLVLAIKLKESIYLCDPAQPDKTASICFEHYLSPNQVCLRFNPFEINNATRNKMITQESVLGDSMELWLFNKPQPTMTGIPSKQKGIPVICQRDERLHLFDKQRCIASIHFIKQMTRSCIRLGFDVPDDLRVLRKLLYQRSTQ